MKNIFLIILFFNLIRCGTEVGNGVSTEEPTGDENKQTTESNDQVNNTTANSDVPSQSEAVIALSIEKTILAYFNLECVQSKLKEFKIKQNLITENEKLHYKELAIDFSDAHESINFKDLTVDVIENVRDLTCNTNEINSIDVQYENNLIKIVTIHDEELGSFVFINKD